MWQHEAASRAVLENGMEEGLGDSSDDPPIAFPQDMQMEMEQETARNHNHTSITVRHYEDQMVPSLTASLLRVGEEEEEEEEENSGRGNLGNDGRAEVPDEDMEREPVHREFAQFNVQIALRNAEDSGAESSNGTGSRRERDGVVVPVWSPANSSFSEQFVGEESSYLQRRPQSHQMVNWRELSQTG